MASFTGVTLAVDAADRVHGYAAWRRGGGVGAGARLEVADLVATRHEATRLLLRTLGSFAPVAPDHADPHLDRPTRCATCCPTITWRGGHERALHAAAARPRCRVRAAPLPTPGRGRGGLRHRRRVPHRPGRLLAAVGRRRAPRRASGPTTPRARSSPVAGWPRRTPAARAPRTCGWPGCCLGDDTDDDTWDALLGGRQVHIRDYF